jgi:hypothetical protein
MNDDEAGATGRLEPLWMLLAGCYDRCHRRRREGERGRLRRARDRATLDASAHGIGLGVNEDAAGCLVSPPSQAAVVVAG